MGVRWSAEQQGRTLTLTGSIQSYHICDVHVSTGCRVWSRSRQSSWLLFLKLVPVVFHPAGTPYVEKSNELKDSYRVQTEYAEIG
jgi:hypothetical protein